MKTLTKTIRLTGFFCLLGITSFAQQFWNSDNSYLTERDGNIVCVTLPAMTEKTLVTSAQLTPTGATTPLNASRFTGSANGKKLLFQADARREFHNTFASCWVYDLYTGSLYEVGKQWGKGALLNAKLSPDGSYVAYVYKSNIYVEDLASHQTRQLTKDGNDKLLNGWFEYVYSEELYLTDGLRWSPDSKSLAFWQMDISKEGLFFMINNTDSIYPKLVPFSFSKPGEAIAEPKAGVVTVADGHIAWIDMEGDPQQYYIPQMDWTPKGGKLLIQQLNRRQNESKLWLCDPAAHSKKLVYTDRDDAWVDIKNYWMRGSDGYEWVKDGSAFVWASEKSGWRKLYLIGLDGSETLITKDDYDVVSLTALDEKDGIVYFMASPDNSTQRYLYRANLDGSGKAQRISPANMAGTHRYEFSPTGKWAQHSFSSHRYMPANEWLSMPGNKPLDDATSIARNLTLNPRAGDIRFFKVTTDEGVEMDGWMLKPAKFDSTKRYPVIFNVYSEPAGTTVTDGAGIGGRRGGFFDVDSGYILMSVEGRGTPVPKGRAWRKAIYRNLGWVNVIDQAGAAKKIMEWPFVDKNRVAVYGSSGGGSTTLHLLFRYPEIYKVGLASAGVPSHFLYNSIYQERFLGLLPECKEDYIKGSAITYAKNLQGHLLIMHGTGDHNVHYQGEEMLLNELIKYNRQFTFMPYPNRTHGISEGEGTAEHKRTMMSNFLREYCPPGGI